MALSETVKSRRAELGMSQSGLAELVGINVRQIARYENDEQQPALPVAVKMADALGISLAQLAGQIEYKSDLSGEWWAAWQTSKDGVERVDIQKMEIVQRDSVLHLTAERAGTIEGGGYAWAGEARVWDNEAIMGWYRATDGAVRSKGTMYFALHPHGDQATGRWVGYSYDGPMVTGLSAMARSESQAEEIMGALQKEAADD